MAKMIKVNLDLSKVDGSKVKRHANGGKYYDIILIETPNGKYGQWLAKQDQTKEEREAGKKDVILGNGKNIGWGSSDSGSKPSGISNVSVDDLGI